MLAFLTLEDRRGEKFCRIFWGIADKPHTIVGITLQGGQPDEVVKAIVNKLSRIKPPLPRGLFYVEPHTVRDDNHQPIPNLYVLEVGVAEGEPDTIYCSESDKVYIRVENTVQELKGQDLIAEIRRRERKLVRHAPKQDAPSFSVSVDKAADYNRLRLKNDGTAGAKNIQIQDVPLTNTKFADKTITFKGVPTLGHNQEAPLAFHYGGFASIDAENASGIHQDPIVPQYLNKGRYTLKVFFTDFNDKRYIQELTMEGGHLTVGPLREG